MMDRLGDGQEGGRDDLFASEQLVLADGDDERLPWLEATDFDEVDRGYDSGRMAGFALLLLLFFGAIVAAVWWFTQGDTVAELQPEGTVIAAPEGPYKVRPTDAGGKTFEGTGDSSFAVGEGKRRESVLAAEPEPDAIVTPSAEPDPAPATTPQTSSGPVVQVGAYATRASAQEGWRTLMRQTTQLDGVKHQIVQGTADIGVVYRLQAIPGDLAAARALCAALKDDGVACQVKR